MRSRNYGEFMSYITEQRERYIKEQESDRANQAKMEIPDRKVITWYPGSDRSENSNSKMQSPKGGRIVSGG
jgi:hypothetical protein